MTTPVADLIYQIDTFVAQLEERYKTEDILDALDEYLEIADELS